MYMRNKAKYSASAWQQWDKSSPAASSYPVDDFGFEGADDAAVVEDRMLFIQLSKRCSRLRGEERCLLQNPPLSGVTGPTRDGGHPSVCWSFKGLKLRGGFLRGPSHHSNAEVGGLCQRDANVGTRPLSQTHLTQMSKSFKSVRWNDNRCYWRCLSVTFLKSHIKSDISRTGLAFHHSTIVLSQCFTFKHI